MSTRKKAARKSQRSRSRSPRRGRRIKTQPLYDLELAQEKALGCIIDRLDKIQDNARERLFHLGVTLNRLSNEVEAAQEDLEGVQNTLIAVLEDLIDEVGDRRLALDPETP